MEDYDESEFMKAPAAGMPTSAEEIQELFNQLVEDEDFIQIEKLFGSEAVAVARKISGQKASSSSVKRSRKRSKTESNDVSNESDSGLSRSAAGAKASISRSNRKGDVATSSSASVQRVSRAQGRPAVLGAKWIPPASRQLVARQEARGKSEHVEVMGFDDDESTVEDDNTRVTEYFVPMQDCVEDQVPRTNQRAKVAASLKRAPPKDESPEPLGLIAESVRVGQIVASSPQLFEGSRSQQTMESVPSKENVSASEAELSVVEQRNSATMINQGSTGDKVARHTTVRTTPIPSPEASIVHNSESGTADLDLSADSTTSARVPGELALPPTDPLPRQHTPPVSANISFLLPRDRNPPDGFSSLPSCYFLHDVLFL